MSDIFQIKGKLDSLTKAKDGLKGEKTERKFLDRAMAKERHQLSKLADQWLATNGRGR